MGESFLAGSEYKDYSVQENKLESALHKLINRRWHAALKNDEITVLVEAELTVKDVIRRENRIETGHLTLDDVYFEVVHDGGFRIFFPLVQFRDMEEYPKSLNFRFDSYRWSFRQA